MELKKNLKRFDNIDNSQWMTVPFETTTEGFLRGRAIVTSIGVFSYARKDGTIQRELRLPEEVFAEGTLNSMKLKPVTLNHPTELVTTDSADKLQVGSLADNPSWTKEWEHRNWTEITDGINCAIDMVITKKDAINAVQSSICSVGNQVGVTGQQVINAIQQGNMSLAQQFAQCCCDNKLLVTQMGYEGQIRDLTNTQNITSQINTVNTGLERGFSSVAYGTAQQTCALQNSMKDQTQTIIDKLSNMEANAQQEKINNLTAQLTAANSRAERAAELKPIIDELSKIRSAQPNTVSVQYPQVSVIPNYNGYNGMSCGYNNGQGFWY